MSQQAKALAIKFDDLESMSGTHTIGRTMDSKLTFTSLAWDKYTERYTPTEIHTIN